MLLDGHLTLQDPPGCFIARLPAEILIEIFDLLHNEVEHSVRLTKTSSANLANVASVSRQFYRLAMPLLWKGIEIEHSYFGRCFQPSPLIKYPGTQSEHALRYIKKMYLCIYLADDDMSKKIIDKVRIYISKCFRVLVAAKSIQYLKLNVRLYDPDAYDSEFSRPLAAINNVVFCLLRHVENMNLRKLEFIQYKNSARIDDILSLIGPKVNALIFSAVPLDSWVDQLAHHEQMSTIKIYNTLSSLDYQDDNSMFSRFWISVSQTRNVTDVDVQGMPLDASLNLHFPHITRLRLIIDSWSFLGGEWASSFLAVFQQFPNLETLRLISQGNTEFYKEIRALNISEIVCKNLRHVAIRSNTPKGIVGTIAKHNANLRSCCIESSAADIEEEDIRHLSRCRDLCSVELLCPFKLRSGLANLTNLSQLESLSLHPTAGKDITTQFLLDISVACPYLDTIDVSDIDREFKSSALKTQQLDELFAVGVELHEYIQPTYMPVRCQDLELDGYEILLDRIRDLPY